MYRLSASAALALAALAAPPVPQGPPNTAIRYQNPTSTVRAFTLSFGPGHWLSLKAVKHDGSTFQLWLQNPASPSRYIFQQGAENPREYRHALSGVAVLPTTVDFNQLLPQTQAGAVTFLGHPYQPGAAEPAPWSLPAGIRTVALRPDLLIGPPHNARLKDDTRRWDGSDYEMVRFTHDDYRTLAQTGINCVNADDEQSAWADALGQFYWGAGKTLPLPDILYRPLFLGPALFLDEPAVHTRDFILRPRLAKDPAFRRSITPQAAFKAFQDYFDDALAKRAHAVLDLPQLNLYSWETMPETAAFQLSRRPNVPEAFVFEPPGRIGARRTLPEFNMTYGTQFAAADTRALADLIFSFLRGAARLSNKNWGVSIYGAVDRADAPLWLTRAYDLGATRFHFWDNYQLAAVPFSEYTALSRHLSNHASSHPDRDLPRLKHAAEVAITLPPGYGLGHTHTGRGNLWGLPELNLERTNSSGVTYRTVMSNFFLEAERLLNAGIAFDSLWELPGLPPSGYCEVVRIREDGKVEVESAGRRTLLPQARRIPAKPGPPPALSLSVQSGAQVTAVARITETAAPVYYTHGTDPQGVYQNAMVLWELYGPAPEDYRFLTPDVTRPDLRRDGATTEVRISFPIDRPGPYRLRAATVDTAGRRTVVWYSLTGLPAGQARGARQ